MAEDFLGEFLGNRNRARIVKVFVLNPSEPFAAEDLAKRSGVARRALSRELKALERLGVVTAYSKSKHDTYWIFNSKDSIAKPLSMFVRTVAPRSHRVILKTLKNVGRVAVVILSGAFVGDSTRPADLLVAGEVNEGRLDRVIRALERRYGHEIRYAVLSTPELRYRLTIQDRLLRETLDYPHVVLLDRPRLL